MRWQVARRYRQGRRGENAAETRRRIVQATFDLHGKQGIAATTMKQIAERAGVSVGSVYHHFPTYDDAINACGAHAFARNPIPTAAIFEGATTRAERVSRLAHALFELFAGLRAFGSVIADKDKLPVLKPFVDQERGVRLALAAEAVNGDDRAAVTLAGLLDNGAWDAFARLGLSPGDAASRIAEVANSWLDATYPQENA